MNNKAKNIILWFLSITMLVGAIGFGLSLTSFLLIVAAILLMPVFNKYTNKLFKFKGLKTISIIALFFIAVAISPAPETNGDLDSNASVNDSVKNKDIDEIVEEAIKENNEEKNSDNNGSSDSSNTTTSNNQATTPSSNSNTNTDSNLELTVTFLDVGQADCIVIKSNDELMVIDSGNNGDATLVTNFIKSQKIDKIKYLIGTHPHEDHIGGMDNVINNFEIETLILPEAVSDTKTFEDVVTAIENKNLEITAPKAGDTYTLGSAAFTIIAPNKVYTELNNMSVGIKLTNGENSFVFCGDAEVLSENDILDNMIDIKSDVLKLSHHGSDTSTSKAFLKAVSPKYAVISCGLDNSYGHPHVDTLQKLLDNNIELYRTDLQGNIIVVSDGKNISFNVKSCDIAESIKKAEEKNVVVAKEESPTVKEETKSEESKSVDYILNKNTKKFHYPSCGSVKQMKESNKKYFSGNRQDVINQGYDPCKKCNP